MAIGFNQQADAIPRHLLGRQLNGQLRRDFIFDQMLGINAKENYDEHKCTDNPAKPVLIDYFNQTLDHFATDPSKAGAWQQVKNFLKIFYLKNVYSIIKSTTCTLTKTQKHLLCF